MLLDGDLHLHGIEPIDIQGVGRLHAPPSPCTLVQEGPYALSHAGAWFG